MHRRRQTALLRMEQPAIFPPSPKRGTQTIILMLIIEVVAGTGRRLSRCLALCESGIDLRLRINASTITARMRDQTLFASYNAVLPSPLH